MLNLHKKYNVLDVETLRLDTEVGGWSTESIRKMGMACSVMHSFDTADEKPIIRIYTSPLLVDNEMDFHGAQDLFYHLAEIATEKKLIIGHNIINFDIEVLHGEFKEYGLLNKEIKDGIPSAILARMLYVDTMTGFGYRISLENLAQAVLGRGKTGNGAMAPILWREKKYKEVIDYCNNDVQLTADIYREYLRNGYIKIHDRKYYPGWRM